ncbi:AMP-binding protein, partial [Nocardia ignorata]
MPKGVVVSHAGLEPFCEEQRRQFDVDADARTLHFASPSFDASVLELLLALGSGATMVIVAPKPAFLLNEVEQRVFDRGPEMMNGFAEQNRSQGRHRADAHDAGHPLPTRLALCQPDGLVIRPARGESTDGFHGLVDATQPESGSGQTVGKPVECRCAGRTCHELILPTSMEERQPISQTRHRPYRSVCSLVSPRRSRAPRRAPDRACTSRPTRALN